MFGLTKREQRWKADQKAAELVASFTVDVVRAIADQSASEALLAAKDSDNVRALYNELLMSVERCYPGETRHETALRYIQQAELGGGEGANAQTTRHDER